MHRYGFGPGYGPDRGGMFIMMIGVIFVILVILLATLVLFLVLKRHGFRHPHNFIHEVNTNRAIEILNEKLANGEIGEEEYTKKKLLITGK